MLKFSGLHSVAARDRQDLTASVGCWIEGTVVLTRPADGNAPLRLAQLAEGAAVVVQCVALSDGPHVCSRARMFGQSWSTAITWSEGIASMPLHYSAGTSMLQIASVPFGAGVASGPSASSGAGTGTISASSCKYPYIAERTQLTACLLFMLYVLPNDRPR